ncbi:MAG: pro-sigmaK processing inhibitor BofA family protein [bacterium]
MPDIVVLCGYGLGFFLLYLLLRFLVVPAKIMLRFLFNAALGGGMLLVLNFLGAAHGFYLPLNPLAALLVGFLGLPGFILLLILHYLTLN